MPDGTAGSTNHDVRRLLAFEVAGTGLVCDMSRIHSVASHPRVTRVPQCKPWLRGVANLHGDLYSVVDLALFGGVAGATSLERGHLLVIGDSSLRASLLVSHVIGLRSFSAVERRRIDPESEQGARLEDSALAASLLGVFKRVERAWFEIDLGLLAASNRFVEIR